MPPPDLYASSSLPREQALPGPLSCSMPWEQSSPHNSKRCWRQSTAPKKATIHSPVCERPEKQQVPAAPWGHILPCSPQLAAAGKPAAAVKTRVTEKQTPCFDPATASGEQPHTALAAP